MFRCISRLCYSIQFYLRQEAGISESKMQTPAPGASILKSKMSTLLQSSFHRSGWLAFQNAYLSRPGSCPVKPEAPVPGALHYICGTWKHLCFTSIQWQLVHSKLSVYWWLVGVWAAKVNPKHIIHWKTPKPAWTLPGVELVWESLLNSPVCKHNPYNDVKLGKTYCDQQKGRNRREKRVGSLKLERAGCST